MKNLTFESFLQEKFIGTLEYRGMPITKDNCEDLFDVWLQDLDANDMIELAEEYGKAIYKQQEIDKRNKNDKGDEIMEDKNNN